MWTSRDELVVDVGVRMSDSSHLYALFVRPASRDLLRRKQLWTERPIAFNAVLLE